MGKAKENAVSVTANSLDFKGLFLPYLGESLKTRRGRIGKHLRDPGAVAPELGEVRCFGKKNYYSTIKERGNNIITDELLITRPQLFDDSMNYETVEVFSVSGYT